jgi:hypothetical protein
VHAEPGSVAAYSIGVVNVGAAGVAVRSAYRKQVERIAPPELVGREAELHELAAFCTEPGRGAYVWWRAPAWAGKSALMSTFVLHPPTGVRVVAFFIAARLGGGRSPAMLGPMLDAHARRSKETAFGGQVFGPWLLATEIDFDSTLVGGSKELTRELVQATRLEARPVGIDDDLTINGDRINQ